MPRLELGNQGRAKFCSYKRATIVICSINIVAALYVLHSLYTSFFIFPNSDNQNSFTAVKYTNDQIRKMEESTRVRQAAEPIELVGLVKGIKEELSREVRVSELSWPMKQKIADEVLQCLKGLNANANVSEQKASLEIWRKEKLEETKQLALEGAISNSTISAEEAKTLQRVLESEWVLLLEEIGLWMPAEIINKESNDKPESEQELEDDIVPGRPIRPECHAEPHTDYGGAAVRWGLTHHKESAADCCEACLDQAKHAKAGEVKCNIWVYCPSEDGCYSPDKYEHKHQECWLKQDKQPKVNFKDKYSDSYRSSHPRAPLIVPWMSGIVGT
ncbi:dimethylallyl, adenosine tRNA methylthiotransferase isoform X2 [Tasmannia lanceolata]|uniref:dimethylallyl, adenosine tRNA methylthiotransferase isoform X2 n=1 Tax=Tasmannia lanceolata TaxID=3420 RepID=UPI0040649EC6